MAASFTYAAVYQVAALCRTPLRTGSSDGDPETVLRGRDGRAFLQGTALAGAFRDWPEEGLAVALFGGPSSEGHLTVSDAIFDPSAGQYTRPRLHIAPETAAGIPGAKFDIAHIGAGAELRFTLVWMGFPGQAARELRAVEQVLAALDAGSIRLGAQKSNGFGRVSLAVEKRVFDLTDPNDRLRWLEDNWEGTPFPLPELERRREVAFTLEGRAENLLVKAAAKNDGSRMCIPNLEEGGTALLPGSSVKGAVRARAAYIARLLGLKASFVECFFGRDARDGDNGLPGLVRFEDTPLSGSKTGVSRIHIDRFTGGVFRGGLFTEEPVCSDLTVRIAAPDQPEFCALLLYALRDLGLGLYSLGSGWAIGRGFLAVRSIQIAAPDGRNAVLHFDEREGITLEDTSGLVREWTERLEEMRHENGTDGC